MKKLLFIGLLSLPLLANEIDDKFLLPEAKQLLVIPDLSESELEQNGYVGMLAVDAPVDIDYMAIAKKVLIKNNHLLQEAIAKQDAKLLEDAAQTTDYYDDNPPLEINMGYPKDYKFPCTSLQNLHCVDQVIKDRKRLTVLIKESNVILERYREIQAKPYYKAYPMTVEMQMPPYHKLLYASQLRLAKAVFAIEDGYVREGLTILQEEMDFIKNRLLVDGYLIDLMIGVRQLLITAHVLEQLIDKPQLKPYLSDPQIITLFQPLSKEQQQYMANTLKQEKQFSVLFSYFATEKTLQQSDESAFYDDAESYYSQAKKLGYPLRFNKVSTINLLYQRLDLLIDKASLVLPASSAKYLVDITIRSQPLTIQEIYQKYGANNLLGGIGIEQDSFSPYLYRFYDVNNYLWLIHAKLQLKQLAISKNKVTKFLLQSNLKNPYSLHSLQWCAKQQVLSSDWLGAMPYWRDGDRARVYIRFD